MFKTLEDIHARPEPFSEYTAEALWTDEHTSARMLEYHLDGDVDISSRNTAAIDRTVEWITERFGIGHGAAVADFGCGPGLYASRLARKGADVTGIDFSLRSIGHARAEAESLGLDIDYVHGNYLEYEPGKPFNLALMIMCDFSALSPAQRARMLRTFRTALRPGGHLLLDVYSLDAFALREETAVCQADLLDGFWSPNPYYGFLNTFKYEQEHVVLDKYTIVEPTRTRTVYNWLQYFSPETLAAELKAHGLEPQSFHQDLTGTPYAPSAPEFAVAAVKA